MTSSTKRVLIYRLGSLGDTVVALPALHLIARAFPQAERRMLTNFPVNVKAPPAAAILENTGLVHGYFRYAAGTRNSQELLSVWWQVLCWRPEVLVYLGSSRGVKSAQRDAAFFRACGIGRLIGVPLTDDMQQNRWETAQGALEPEGARLVRNIAELGDGCIDAPASWDLHLTEAERERADEALRPVTGVPLVAVSVGTKVQSKDWGRENWRALLAGLQGLIPVMRWRCAGRRRRVRRASLRLRAGGRLAAGGGEFVRAAYARGRVRLRSPAPASLLGMTAGRCTLRRRCRRLAWLFLRPGISLGCGFRMGSRHRVVYHQTECWGCGLETCVVERKRCLTSITVEEVFEEVRAVFSQKKPDGRVGVFAGDFAKNGS